MMDGLHARSTSNIHGALKALVLLFYGPSNSDNDDCPLTSHHSSPEGIPDSLGGPSCKLTHSPVGGLFVASVPQRL